MARVTEAVAREQAVVAATEVVEVAARETEAAAREQVVAADMSSHQEGTAAVRATVAVVALAALRAAEE